MSTERHPSRTQHATTERSDGESADRLTTEIEIETDADIELEFESPVATRAQSADDSRTATQGAELDTPLAHRIERTKLQTQVTALERALETSEYRQYEIVTQYERLLAERTDDGAEGEDTTASHPDGLLYRLLERWR